MRLLVVGGGHASLPTLADAHALVEAGHEVTLLSDRSELWYSGMTPEWLGGVYTRRDVTIDLAEICAREGVAFQQGRAVGIDRQARTVRTADDRTLGYDLVAFDVGAVNPGLDAAGPAVQTKPLHEIETLGDWLAEAGRGDSSHRLVVVGGGAAGVEVALNVTARADLRGRVDVTIVTPESTLVPSMPGRLQRWAAETVRRRGGTVHVHARADHVEAGTVVLESGERLHADRVLWATGSVGPPWLGDGGLDTTDQGFVRVSPGLQSRSDPRVFVAGDAASVEGHESLARIGVHAVKQGPVLRENLARSLDALRQGTSLEHTPLTPFRPYLVSPLILSTGTSSGWLAAGPLALRGAAVLRLKHAVDRRWMARYASHQPSYTSLWDHRSADRPLPVRRSATLEST